MEIKEQKTSPVLRIVAFGYYFIERCHWHNNLSQKENSA